jgi:molybdate transport system substrate-binding protein
VQPGVRAVLARPGTLLGTVSRQALTRISLLVPPVRDANDAKGVIDAITSGAADGGIVYATDAHAAGGRVTTVAIPAAQGMEADYVVAQPTSVPHRALGREFMKFLFTKPGQDAVVDHGFVPITCYKPVTEGGCGIG